MLVTGICLLNCERIECLLYNVNFFHCVCGNWDSNMQVTEGLQVQEDQLWLDGRERFLLPFFVPFFSPPPLPQLYYWGVEAKWNSSWTLLQGLFSLRVSSPPILPVLCYLCSTGLVNCSDEFPSNLFLEEMNNNSSFHSSTSVESCWYELAEKNVLTSQLN